MVRTLKKLLVRLFGPHPEDPRKTGLVHCPPSTVLLNGFTLDFRVGHEDRAYVTMGERCIIDGIFTFESKAGQVTIGNNVHLGGGRFICRSSIVVGNDVTMAWGITVYDHDSHSVDWRHRVSDSERCYADYHNHGGNNIATKDWTHVKTKPIRIENKVWIGFNVIILKGVTIGEGAVIGAGSVVTKDIPPFTVAAGNPARVVKRLE